MDSRTFALLSISGLRPTTCAGMTKGMPDSNKSPLIPPVRTSRTCGLSRKGVNALNLTSQRFRTAPCRGIFYQLSLSGLTRQARKRMGENGDWIPCRGMEWMGRVQAGTPVQLNYYEVWISVHLLCSVFRLWSQPFAGMTSR